MQAQRIRELIGFYENELTNNLLSFWMPRCADTLHGGYFNCFDNTGSRLLSHNKYTWSQGRFVWLFAKLAMMDSPTFTAGQRRSFAALAKQGRDFLFQHCLVGQDDWRCVFLMDETGRPVAPEGSRTFDQSIYADCFVAAAFARYALAADEAASFRFARRLYDSILARVQSGQYRTEPYPLDKSCRAHGIPMILCHVTREILLAAQRFAPDDKPGLKKKLSAFCQDILDNFTDPDDVIREVIRADNSPLPNLLGQHANPGHTLECVWFLSEAAESLNRPRVFRKAADIARRACQIGWDADMGGLLHFCHIRGGQPDGTTEGVVHEPMVQQVLSGWGDKLWWVHSEALYTTLLCHAKTGEADFLAWHDRLADYAFSTFPNPDREIREWIQIRKRDGSPQNKVVALPVKDPYHIMRNVVQMIELLYKLLGKTGAV